MRKVVVPGTFDPITLGHMDVITRSSQLFDEVIVGVAASQGKGAHGPLFTLDERVALAKSEVKGLDNVTVQPFDNLLVEFARSVGACAVVKGLRATTDFEYEFQMAALNYRLDKDLEALFVMSSPEHMYVSSSVAKEIARMDGPLKGITSLAVENALRAKYGLDPIEA